MKKITHYQSLRSWFSGLTILLSFCTNSLFAGTVIPAGNVSGTWAHSGSPYHITGTIQVPSTQTLSIQPGVIIEFDDSIAMNVYGCLHAIGSNLDTIVFTAIHPLTGWGGLHFSREEDADTSRMKYCEVQYGQEYGLRSERDSKVSISNSLIAYNYKGGVFANGCELWFFNTEISHNSGNGISFSNKCLGTVNSTIVSNNQGNGIVCSIEADVRISRSTVFHNSGNGINCGVEGYANINNNIISNNSGRGISGAYTFMLIDHNLVSNNSGGGIYCDYWCYALITNTTIVNNHADEGGALYTGGFSIPTFRNCILWGNTADTGGPQVFIADDDGVNTGISKPNFYYCNVQGGEAAFELNGNAYTGIYQNNSDAVPRFISPSAGCGTGFNGLNANWSLQPTSPCINKGDPTGTYPLTDLAGNPGVSACRIDMGAYEFQSPLLTVTINQTHKLLCFGDTSAEIKAKAEGGAAPYTYTWNTSPLQTTKTVTGLSASNYAVTVSDANGCTNTASISITQPPPLKVSAGNNAIVYPAYPVNACAKLCGTASGGIMPYHYDWSHGVPLATTWVCPNTAKQYTVTVTDANGCKARDAVKVCTINAQAGGGKVILCHKRSDGTTASIIVSSFLVPYHLAHGDNLGSCGTSISCPDGTRISEPDEDTLIIGDEINLSSYPNPFLQETTVRFTAPECGDAEVSVYNAMGVKVVTLFNGNLEALEIHEAKFTAENLSNGIYFVKLITEKGDIRTERLLLNR
jgi:Right handed beta helix region/Secretion system C-terminal sorting domain/SprB repeat